MGIIIYSISWKNWQVKVAYYLDFKAFYRPVQSCERPSCSGPPTLLYVSPLPHSGFSFRPPRPGKEVRAGVGLKAPAHRVED